MDLSLFVSRKCGRELGLPSISIPCASGLRITMSGNKRHRLHLLQRPRQNHSVSQLPELEQSEHEHRTPLPPSKPGLIQKIKGWITPKKIHNPVPSMGEESVHCANAEQSIPEGRINQPSTIANVPHVEIPSDQLSAQHLAKVDSVREAATGAIGVIGIPFGSVLAEISNENSWNFSFDSFLSTLSKFTGTLDTISKVHPYAHVAWSVLSLASKIIIRQATRDNSVRSLLSKMNEVYTFLIKAELRDIDSMKTIVEDICRQTLECSYFIREYSQNEKFRTRLLKHLLSGTDAVVRNYNNVFDELLQQFRNHAARDTLVVVHRIWKGMEGLEALVEDSDLNSMPYVWGAGLDTEKLCLEGTRSEILDEITTWINNTEDDTSRIFWLHGNAGTGKSSIAHTIAHRFNKLGRLGSCYCFNRNEIVEQRHKKIFTTIARDLADRDNQMRKELVAAVHLNTSLKNTADVSQQWKELIMKPAKAISDAMMGPIVIIIDALDESGGIDSRKHLLRILAGKLDDDESCISKLPPHFRILITSRPLPDIDDALNDVEHVQQKSMDSIPSASTRHDILRYVSFELSALKEIQSQEVSVSLAHASDGLFEWARLACAYLKGDDDAGLTAMERFEVVITHNKDDCVPLLDSMYKLTLETIFPPDKHMHRGRSIRLDRFRSVMAQILGTEEPLPLASLTSMRQHFKHLQEIDINTIIRPLSALLNGTTDSSATIRPLHASFPEFLMDENRSGEFFVDLSHIHGDLAFASLRVMENRLRFNICRLPSSYLPNSEIPDLAERVKMYISPELSYSCRFWTDHLRKFNLPLTEAVRAFFNHERFLFWLEALSLLRAINTCTSSLSSVVQWVASRAECKDISDHAADTQRFVRIFSGTISFSTPHLYLSALPLSPKNSHISKKFAHKFPKVLQIVQGHNMTWPVIQDILHGHSSAVNSIAFSPNGKHIVSGSQDQTIRLWDAETGELLWRVALEGLRTWFLSVAFSPDGKRIVSGLADKTIRLWDTETGELLGLPLEGHGGQVRSVAFSSDGKCIVSGSNDMTIRLWDTTTGQLLQPPLKGHKGWVSSVAFSPDGKHVVSGSNDNTIRMWDAKTGGLLRQTLEGHQGWVMSVAFSPDGKCIVSGSADMTIRLWDIKMGELLRLPLKDYVRSVAFSPDGKLIVSGSDDQSVRVWNVETGQQLRPPLEGHKSWVRSVVFSPDGKRIVSSSDDKTIRMWDAEGGELPQQPLEGHSSWVESVAFSPDGKHIVSGSADKTIQVWDAKTGEMLQPPLKGHESWVGSVAFSPDGKHIVSGSDDKTIRVWDAETGELLRPPLKGHESWIGSVAFSPDSKCLVSGSDDMTIRLWDIDMGELLQLPVEGCVRSVTFSPDGKHILSGSDDKAIRMWDAETGELLQPPLEGHEGQIESVAFSPDGKYIVSGSGDKTIRLWGVETGMLLGLPLEGHEGRVCSVAFSPDGKRIVSGSDDRTIRVWDVETGEQLQPPLEGHEDQVTSVAFSPDGKCIVSGSNDKTIRVWNAEMRKLSLRHSFVEKQALICFSSHSGHALIDAVDLVGDMITLSGHRLTDLVEMTKLGWVCIGPKHKLLFCVPPTYHPKWYLPNMQMIIPSPDVQLDLSHMAHGSSWDLCYQKTT